MKRNHIDDVQTSTVDEHIKVIIEDENVLDPEQADITSDNIPDWYDEKLFKEGQNYYNRNMLLGEICYILALISIFAVPSMRQVLKCTKHYSTSCLAFKRHVTVQFRMANLTLCNPSDQYSNWYKTINIIRWRHNISAKISKKMGIEGILQKDMALTQCVLIAYIFIITKSFSLGLCEKIKEEEGLNHFWRVIGYMLGIPDRLNICRKNAKETRELCEKIINDVFANYLKNVSSDYYHITSTMLDGMRHMDISFNKDAMLALTFQLCNIKYKASLGWYSWLNMKCRDFLLKLYFLPYIGTVVRIYCNFMITFIFWSATILPVFAWLSYGKKKSHVYLNFNYK